MSQTVRSPGFFAAKVTQVRRPCREHFELTLGLDAFPESIPGQFVQLLCSDAEEATRSRSPSFPEASAITANGPLLRRPFSIGGLKRTPTGIEMRIIGRVVGVGTAWLNERRAGDEIDLLGPLGRGFTPPDDNRKVILVAGGVGIPPILWWGEVLRASGVECSAIYGVRSREFLPLSLTKEPVSAASFDMCVSEFSDAGIPAILTTEDGSCGMRGRVTDALRIIFDQQAIDATPFVYACGPEPMLRAVGNVCSEFNAPCELAMERVMGCGMGTCQSCVVPVNDQKAVDGWRYALCCMEGPVFDATKVRWQNA